MSGHRLKKQVFSGNNESQNMHQKEGTNSAHFAQKIACQALRVCFATDVWALVIHEWRTGRGFGKLMGGKERF